MSNHNQVAEIEKCDFEINELVFVKMAGFKEWWPSRIIQIASGHFVVHFLGDRNRRSPPLPKPCIKKLGDFKNSTIVQKQKNHKAFMVAWDECLLLINHIKTATEADTANDGRHSQKKQTSKLEKIDAAAKTTENIVRETRSKTIRIDDGTETKQIDVAAATTVVGCVRRIDIAIKRVAATVKGNKVQIDVAVKSLSVEGGAMEVETAGTIVGCASQTGTKSIRIDCTKSKKIRVAESTTADGCVGQTRSKTIPTDDAKQMDTTEKIVAADLEANEVQIDVAIKSVPVGAMVSKAAKTIDRTRPKRTDAAAAQAVGSGQQMRRSKSIDLLKPKRTDMTT